MTAAALPVSRPLGLAIFGGRTVRKLAMIFVLVTMLTSETLWAHFLKLVGAEDTFLAEPVPPSAYSDREIAQLVRLTESPNQFADLSADEAQERNEAIPFVEVPAVGAKPFRALSLESGTGLTALRCLTQAVYYEAAYEPLQGRRAVAQVVLNRMRHSAFPKSVCGVVYEGVNRPVCQFSFTCDGSLKRKPSAAAWREAEEVAAAALAGYVERSVGLATHYHANYVSPYWAPKLAKISKIGAHIFYRWPGKWGMPSAFSGLYSGNEAIPHILPRAFLSAKGATGASVVEYEAE
ncbi:MAG: cell wall hydrolase, partial [Sphingomonadales bacterium]|nr:cell wall hydrolase [Sphingomonadales bacterium]